MSNEKNNSNLPDATLFGVHQDRNGKDVWTELAPLWAHSGEGINAGGQLRALPVGTDIVVRSRAELEKMRAEREQSQSQQQDQTQEH